MPVSSKIEDLHGLQKLLNAQSARARLLHAASGEAKRLVQVGFATESDPSGKPWLPLKFRKGKILRDTARMANSFTTNATENGFVVGSNVSYVGYQNDGTRGHKASERSLTVAYNAKTGKFIKRSKAGKQKSGSVHLMNLKFQQGNGKVPARPMVPPNGQLTDKWRTAIDTACDSTMATMAKEAGGK